MSAVIHLLGLGFTFRVGGPEGAPETRDNSVPVGTTFEELAEDIAEPVEPEKVEEPEPPLETPPEPEAADIPTSEALVASENPQQVVSPDIGSASEVSPEPAEPVQPTTDTAEDIGARQGTDAQEDVTPPLEPDAVAEAPIAPPVESDVEVEDVSPDPTESIETEQVTEVDPQDIQDPVSSSTVPVVPLESDPVVPDNTERVEQAEPLLDNALETNEESTLAVARSIRPRAPSRSSAAVEKTPDRLFDNAQNFDALRFPEQAIESPLATYRRQGVDAFADADVGTQPSARGGGNSDTTNYAGRVLVHLNNAPTTHVPGRGHAQVYFEINPDGSLARVNIVDSSGSIKIDNAAKAQVRAAAPFPKPPGGKSRTMSFYYRIN
ncbi:TonB family protein [Falsiruegeria litorea]|uniref:TonB family protein n=1 Tax=Falsiruegeria litorea TaxID=1280831 RepID=UPI001F277021|nr:TonB family protein [Falsiruegeria litorea]